MLVSISIKLVKNWCSNNRYKIFKMCPTHLGQQMEHLDKLRPAYILVGWTLFKMTLSTRKTKQALLKHYNKKLKSELHSPRVKWSIS